MAEKLHNPTYTGLEQLGLVPRALTDEVLAEMFEVVRQHRGRIDLDAMVRGVKRA